MSRYKSSQRAEHNVFDTAEAAATAAAAAAVVTVTTPTGAVCMLLPAALPGWGVSRLVLAVNRHCNIKHDRAWVIPQPISLPFLSLEYIRVRSAAVSVRR